MAKASLFITDAQAKLTIKQLLGTSRGYYRIVQERKKALVLEAPAHRIDALHIWAASWNRSFPTTPIIADRIPCGH